MRLIKNNKKDLLKPHLVKKKKNGSMSKNHLTKPIYFYFQLSVKRPDNKIPHIN